MSLLKLALFGLLILDSLGVIQVGHLLIQQGSSATSVTSMIQQVAWNRELLFLLLIRCLHILLWLNVLSSRNSQVRPVPQAHLSFYTGIVTLGLLSPLESVWVWAYVLLFLVGVVGLLKSSKRPAFLPQISRKLRLFSLIWLVVVLLPLGVFYSLVEVVSRADPLHIHRVQRQISDQLFIPARLPEEFSYQETFAITDELQQVNPTVRTKIGSGMKAIILRQTSVDASFNLNEFVASHAGEATTQRADISHQSFSTPAYVNTHYLPDLDNTPVYAVTALSDEGKLVSVTAVFTKLESVLEFFEALELQ